MKVKSLAITLKIVQGDVLAKSIKEFIHSIRGTSRTFLFFIWAVAATIAVLLVRFLGAGLPAIFGIFEFWKKVTNWFMGLEIEIQGNIPDQPAIIMPNHRSYVDVMLLPSKIPLVYVAKAEVAKWPVIGWGANAMHTVWVNRNSADSRRETRNQIKERLQANESVIVFPEGTTHTGPEALPLKPGMFYVVADGGFKVVPTAIEYQDVEAAWVGKDTFIPHFLEQFGKRKMKVKVRFGDPIWNADGEKLRAQVHEWMNKNLLEMRKEWSETE